MIRPMTSNVSTLSSCVAKSHQAIHFVSSAPSKIPYGGFSPVRLQTRFKPRPPSQTHPRLLIGRHCRYLGSRRCIRSRTCVQAAPGTSDHDHESILSGRLVAYYGHIRASEDLQVASGLFPPGLAPKRQPQRVPNLLRQSLLSMPSPVLRWSQRLHSTMPSTLVLPSPNSYWLDNHWSHQSESGGSCNEAAAFA